jgi:hypothetical protein
MTFWRNPFLVATDVAVFASDRYPGDCPDAASKFFGDGHTAVFATCTSYCDGGVPLIFANVTTKGGTQHEYKTVEILFDVRLAEYER